MFVTPSLDIASSRLWWSSCGSRACRRTTSGAILAFAFLVSFTFQNVPQFWLSLSTFFWLTFSRMINIFSCTFQLGEYLLFESVSPHRLCRSFMNQSAAGLRVNELSRIKFEQASSPLLTEVRFSIFFSMSSPC